jgi:hypothetical protein
MSTIGDPQPSPQQKMPGAVQRLDVSGVTAVVEALRYSPASVEKREDKSIDVKPMVARLKLKGIDGRAPPGVDKKSLMRAWLCS